MFDFWAESFKLEIVNLRRFWVLQPDLLQDQAVDWGTSLFGIWNELPENLANESYGVWIMHAIREKYPC